MSRPEAHLLAERTKANTRRNICYSLGVAAVRTCRVTLKDVDGGSHAVTVQGTTLFEVAAAALSAFRSEKWAADALTPNAVLNIEVQVPPVLHTVPLKAIERWLRSPNTSPQQMLAKRAKP
jgi:hypothetical protein